MIKIAVIVILPTFLENFVKFHIKTSQFSLKNQKLNLGQIFFAHLKFSIFGYFSCHNGSKNALISGHSTSFGISSNSLSHLGHKKIGKKILLNTWLVSVEHSVLNSVLGLYNRNSVDELTLHCIHMAYFLPRKIFFPVGATVTRS